MSRNILVVTLDAMENDPQALRYFSVKNEYGNYYCDAVQTMEASTKYVLSRFPIDTIIAIGDDPSVFDLYRSRVMRYIDDDDPEQPAAESPLPAEDQAKIIDFIQRFLEKYSQRKNKRLNRFFDELSLNVPLYDQFIRALYDAFPVIRENPGPHMKWVLRYLYAQLKASAKLDLLQVNEKIDIRYVPADMMTKQEHWLDDILGVSQEVIDGKEEIHLYISLDNDSTVDGMLLMSLLDILIATPGSNVHAKKIYRVYEPAAKLTGMIEDNTYVSLSSELVAAAHAFLNYSKTDMLVDFWEKYGDGNSRISSMIYAARHVDIGMSMCNLSEVQQGIWRLREIFRDQRPWKDDGEFGVLFGIIAESVQADYKSLLAGDGKVSFIELIKWAYRHQLYQQVLTLIETYAPFHLVSTGIFFYCDDQADAEAITKLLALQRMELKSYELYKMDDIEHYFIKYYDRDSVRLTGSRDEDRNRVFAAVRAQSTQKQDSSRICGRTVCDSLETVQNVLYAYYHLGQVRNKISHADEDAMAERRLIVSESDISSAMMAMRESIEYFILSYEKAIEEAAGKDPNVVFISANEVRQVSERLRHERFPSDRRPYAGRRPQGEEGHPVSSPRPAAGAAANAAPVSAPGAAGSPDSSPASGAKQTPASSPAPGAKESAAPGAEKPRPDFKAMLKEVYDQ